jgi:hypothetical protein
MTIVELLKYVKAAGGLAEGGDVARRQGSISPRFSAGSDAEIEQDWSGPLDILSAAHPHSLWNSKNIFRSVRLLPDAPPTFF